MRDKCEAHYLEEEVEVGGDVFYQVTWIQMPGMDPQVSDAVIPHYLAPRLDPDVNWVTNIVTPF